MLCKHRKGELAMREHLFLNPNEYLTVEEFHLIRKMDLPQDFLDFLEIGFRTGLRLNDILNLKKENKSRIMKLRLFILSGLCAWIGVSCGGKKENSVC